MMNKLTTKPKDKSRTGRTVGPVDSNSVPTGKEGYIFETRKSPIHYKGFAVPSNLTALWSKIGEDAVVDLKEALRRDGTYRALRDYVDTISSGASIRKLREKLKLTQKEAGELLGGGANSFQKYESGEVSPSQSMINLLLLLSNDTTRIKELKLSKKRLPPPISRREKTDNRTFSLQKRKGLADSYLVLIAAKGLLTKIMLVELKKHRKGRDWAVMTQKIGVKHKGKMVYRSGLLDKIPVKDIVSDALEEYGLDSEAVNWKDILLAADG